LLAWVDNREKDTSLPASRVTRLSAAYLTKAGSFAFALFVEAISGEEESEIRGRLNEQYAHFKNILKTRILERAPGSDGEQLAWLLLALVDGLWCRAPCKTTVWISTHLSNGCRLTFQS
jgi:hypothetical protein